MKPVSYTHLDVYKRQALLAIAILANSRPELREKLKRFRAEQADKVARETLP